VADAGLKLVIEGVAEVIANATSLETAPLGVATLMAAVPGCSIRLAGTAAATSLPLTMRLDNGAPFHLATAPATKPVPAIVSVNAGPAAIAAFGLRPVTIGRSDRAVIVNVTPRDVAPPGLLTVIGTLPGVAMRLAGIGAVTCPAFTKVVLSGDPLQLTVAPGRKPAPVAANVNAGPPASTEPGDTPVSVGGFAVTVKVALAGVVSAPLSACTWTTRGAEIRLAATVAVSWVERTNVAANGEPSHKILVPPWKPVPFTVKTKAGPPAATDDGLRLVIVGPAAVIGNDAALEALPSGFTTVTDARPASSTRLPDTVAESCVALRKDVGSAAPFHCTAAPL
jgi:hypothetical protein